MKAVKVEYTVSAEFAEQNKINIKRVMEKLRNEPIDGMLYSSYTLEDSNSFVHINIARDGDTMNKLNEMQEFLDFRKALKKSNPIIPPKATKLLYIAAGFDL